LLEKTRRRHLDDDVLYRLANLYAIRGDPANARSTILDAIDNGLTSRSHYDVPLLFLQLAIGNHSSEDAAKAISYLADRGPFRTYRPIFRKSLEARANLWWDESTVTDGLVETVDLDADGDAVACLTRWRLGVLAEDDLVKIQTSVGLNPDSFKLGTLALAAALISNAQSEKALIETDRVISALTLSSTWDYTDAEILKLAHTMRAVALEAVGDSEAAASSARALASRLDPDLLPGILAREVLDRTNK